jgi:nitroreductase/SAM-dependent methyltransferase
VELTEAILKRRSVRSFTRAPLSADLVVELVNAARYAPTSCNLQVHKFIYVDDEALLAEYARKVTGKVNWAPQLIVVAVDPKITYENHANYVSLGMAVQNLLLRAHELGLAACPIAGFGGKRFLRKTLGIPSRFDIPLLIVLGFEDLTMRHEVTVPKRCTADQLMSRNSYRFDDLFPVSSDIAAWTQQQIVEYRSRIMAVYYPRFRHGAWGQASTTVVERLLAGSEGKSVLWYFAWGREILDEARRRNVVLLVADVLPDYLQFLRDGHGDVVREVVLLGQPAKHEPTADCAVIDTSIIFQKDLGGVFRSATAALRPGGELRVAVFARWGLFAVAVRLLQAVGIKRDVYHKSPFYKIGPYGFPTDASIRGMGASCGLEMTGVEPLRTKFLAERIGIPPVRRLAETLGRAWPETRVYCFRKKP